MANPIRLSGSLVTRVRELLGGQFRGEDHGSFRGLVRHIQLNPAGPVTFANLQTEVQDIITQTRATDPRAAGRLSVITTALRNYRSAAEGEARLSALRTTVADARRLNRSNAEQLATELRDLERELASSGRIGTNVASSMNQLAELLNSISDEDVQGAVGPDPAPGPAPDPSAGPAPAQRPPVAVRPAVIPAPQPRPAAPPQQPAPQAGFAHVDQRAPVPPLQEMDNIDPGVMVGIRAWIRHHSTATGFFRMPAGESRQVLDRALSFLTSIVRMGPAQMPITRLGDFTSFVPEMEHVNAGLNIVDAALRSGFTGSDQFSNELTALLNRPLGNITHLAGTPQAGTRQDFTFRDVFSADQTIAFEQTPLGLYHTGLMRSLRSVVEQHRANTTALYAEIVIAIREFSDLLARISTAYAQYMASLPADQTLAHWDRPPRDDGGPDRRDPGAGPAPIMVPAQDDPNAIYADTDPSSRGATSRVSDPETDEEEGEYAPPVPPKAADIDEVPAPPPPPPPPTNNVNALRRQLELRLNVNPAPAQDDAPPPPPPASPPPPLPGTPPPQSIAGIFPNVVTDQGGEGQVVYSQVRGAVSPQSPAPPRNPRPGRTTEEYLAMLAETQSLDRADTGEKRKKKSFSGSLGRLWGRLFRTSSSGNIQRTSSESDIPSSGVRVTFIDDEAPTWGPVSGGDQPQAGPSGVGPSQQPGAQKKRKQKKDKKAEKAMQRPAAPPGVVPADTEAPVDEQAEVQLPPQPLPSVIGPSSQPGAHRRRKIKVAGVLLFGGAGGSGDPEDPDEDRGSDRRDRSGSRGRGPDRSGSDRRDRSGSRGRGPDRRAGPGGSGGAGDPNRPTGGAASGGSDNVVRHRKAYKEWKGGVIPSTEGEISIHLPQTVRLNPGDRYDHTMVTHRPLRVLEDEMSTDGLDEAQYTAARQTYSSAVIAALRTHGESAERPGKFGTDEGKAKSALTGPTGPYRFSNIKAAAETREYYDEHLRPSRQIGRRAMRAEAYEEALSEDRYHRLRMNNMVVNGQVVGKALSAPKEAMLSDYYDYLFKNKTPVVHIILKEEDYQGDNPQAPNNLPRYHTPKVNHFASRHTPDIWVTSVEEPPSVALPEPSAKNTVHLTSRGIETASGTRLKISFEEVGEVNAELVEKDLIGRSGFPIIDPNTGLVEKEMVHKASHSKLYDLVLKKGITTHKVRVIQTMGWRDKTAATSEELQEILELRKEALDGHNPSKAITHCQAGVGRTGVILAAEAMANTGAPLVSAVAQLRDSRNRTIVQTDQQAKLLLDWALDRGLEILPDQLDQQQGHAGPPPPPAPVQPGAADQTGLDYAGAPPPPPLPVRQGPGIQGRRPLPLPDESDDEAL